MEARFFVSRASICKLTPIEEHCDHRLSNWKHNHWISCGCNLARLKWKIKNKNRSCFMLFIEIKIHIKLVHRQTYYNNWRWGSVLCALSWRNGQPLQLDYDKTHALQLTGMTLQWSDLRWHGGGKCGTRSSCRHS